MHELRPDQFSRVSPLLAALPQTVLPYAVCQGFNPGRVFADDPQMPRRALLWTPVGYFFLCGQPTSEPDTLRTISSCLTGTMVPAAQEKGESGFIFITSPGWEPYLPTLLPNRQLISIYRRPFVLDAPAFASLTVPSIPPGFDLARIDATLVEQTSLPACWGAPDAFARHGFGFALLHKGQIAASCATVFTSDRAVEIDVQTAELYRRRGFALITATAFLAECIRRGLRPNWECFWDNQPSTALAARLGFKPLPDFPVTYWEETAG